DLVLPMMNGLAATRRLKADARTAQIPGLALRGRGLADDEARAAGAGGEGFITKPFSLEPLLGQVAPFPGRDDPVGGADDQWEPGSLRGDMIIALGSLPKCR